MAGGGGVQFVLVPTIGTVGWGCSVPLCPQQGQWVGDAVCLGPHNRDGGLGVHCVLVPTIEMVGWGAVYLGPHNRDGLGEDVMYLFAHNLASPETLPETQALRSNYRIIGLSACIHYGLMIRMQISFRCTTRKNPILQSIRYYLIILL